MRSSAELGRRTQDSANADYPEAWCRVDGTNARIARTQIIPRGGGALGWHDIRKARTQISLRRAAATSPARYET